MDNTNESLPIGSDANELFTDRSVKEKILIFNGKQWLFKYRELTWLQEGTVRDTSLITTQKPGDESIRIGISMHEWKYLCETIVEAPFSMNEATRHKLSPEFGELLVRSFMSPMGLTEDDSKNSKEPSEAEVPT